VAKQNDAEPCVRPERQTAALFGTRRATRRRPVNTVVIRLTMPSRKLRQNPAENGRVRFALEADGDVSEADVASELTAFVFAVDPALDSRTGRLIPGKLGSEIRTSLFLTPPDDRGISHVGGIECAQADAEVVARHAEAGGYVVVQDV
jgi:hypothetical protein